MAPRSTAQHPPAASLVSTQRLHDCIAEAPRSSSDVRARRKRERVREAEVASQVALRTTYDDAPERSESRLRGQIVAGKYRLIEPLARGAMGTIWRAEHVLLNSLVALKLIDDSAPFGSVAQLRFLREARTAARLRGAHVVELLDYGLDGERAYLVMELLAGESLRERLVRRGSLSKRETARIVTQLARALERARRFSIVHRDLSPSNVFLERADASISVKLLDFGIAKWLSESDAFAPNLTVSGAILGTPSYMSPEQLEASSSLDWRADIWALGVIAFECLLGHVPFRGDTFPALVVAICSRPLPVPSELGRVPAAFDAWFAKACARSPKERFGSASEAALELRRSLGCAGRPRSRSR
ncbi:MAG TPA: serine/threonine-protein kinase [Polyangiaceae bacterium]|nr:serine/threonine-protein kinase [Polyangiaceae bacterium]